VQLGVLNGFEELYNPIIGTTSDSTSHEPTMTPQVLLDRSRNLQQAYTELKADLMDEVNMMDVRIIRPAMDAKEYIQPIKKTIKKRDNKRLDYERHFDKVTNAAKKPRRTDKDEVALAKAEVELSKATDVSYLFP
jgi:amphiphysin